MGIRVADPKKLEEMIAKRGESLTEFSKVSGVSIHTVLSLLSKDRNKSPKTCKKIADTLGVAWEEIFVVIPRTQIDKGSDVNENAC